MPVTVIVGGQFGSEGKGKVSAYFASTKNASAIVRVGGPNSGHTAIDKDGIRWTFRQLPAGLVQCDAPIFLPAGSLIDTSILLSEVSRYSINPSRLKIDPRATIVTSSHISAESKSNLISRIGSTGSGTGAALLERISRVPDHKLAKDDSALQPYLVDDVSSDLRSILKNDGRIVVEGTQGFGLSIWHSDYFPFATSRDTTASGFISEAGLAPHDVDEVVLVLRTFPIRVGGNSGPLPNEIDWPTLAKEAHLASNYQEVTTATSRVRRIGRFDPDVVKRAIRSNSPHKIVLNHLDYVDPEFSQEIPTDLSRSFINKVERMIDYPIDLLGYGPSIIVNRRICIGRN